MLGRVGTTMQSQALNGRVVGKEQKQNGAAQVLRRERQALQHARVRLNPTVTLQVPAPLLFRTRGRRYCRVAEPRPTQLVTRGEPRIGESCSRQADPG